MDRARLVVVTAALLLVTVAPAAPIHALPTSGAPRGSSPSWVAYAAEVPAGSRVAPLGAATSLQLTFTLGFSNASRLASALAAVQDPASPSYRHFLTYAEFQRAYGPSAATVASAEAALRSAGATEVERAPGGTSITAVVPVADAQRLLGVRLVSYEAPDGVEGYTAVGTPTLPSSLAGEVTAVDGLSSASSASRAPAADVRPLPAVAPSPAPQFVKDGYTGDQWFIGTDYAQAYGATDLVPGNLSVRGATYPTGVAIATLLASGYNVPTETSLPPWDPSVVDAYYNDTFPGGWPLPRLTGVPVLEPIAGAPLPPGSFGGLNDSLGFEVENSLDLEMAGSMAPGARLYNFYFNGSLLANPLTEGAVQQYFAADLGKALNYSYGGPKLAIVSCSFGLTDLVDGQWDALLEEASLMGVTVVSASGDQGNSPPGANGRGQGPDPLWPASAAFNTSGAVAVGGVTIQLSGKPTSTYSYPPIAVAYDTNVQGIAGTTAWWLGSGGYGTFAGTEGGIATTYAQPYWQFHSAAQPNIVNATERQHAGALGRAEPDVAFAANSTIAYVAQSGRSSEEFEVVGGTSVAAPVFAGMLADIIAVENSTLPGGRSGLGYLAPELYRIASFYAASPGPTDPFQDVTTGHNYLFTASRGWDPLTGWGELYAPLLLQADENTTLKNYVYTGPTPTLPPAAGPLFSPLELTALFVGVAAAILVAAYVVIAAHRRSRRAAPYDPTVYEPAVAPPAWNGVAPPSPPFATFACPYCGAPRPAEPGHCPTCGAM